MMTNLKVIFSDLCFLPLPSFWNCQGHRLAAGQLADIVMAHVDGA
jgi:hypothetical protein